MRQRAAALGSRRIIAGIAGALLLIFLWSTWFTVQPEETGSDVLRLNPELPREMNRFDLRLTRDSLTVRGRDGAAAPISLCVDGKICEFVSGTTRVFRLNGEARDDAIAEKDPLTNARDS